MTKDENKQRGGDDKISTVRTFESDAAEFVKKTGQSKASIVLAESERKDRQSDFFSLEKQKNPEGLKFILSITGILLLGGIIIFMSFVFFKPEKPLSSPYAGGQPIIIIDNQKTVEIGGIQNEKALEKIVETIENSSIGISSILSIRPIKTTEEKIIELETKEFLELTSRFAPDKFVRSLEEVFVLGLVGFDGNQPFLIFKTDSFENAAGGIIEWERNMSTELQTIFEKEDGWAETPPAYGPGSTSKSPFGNAVVNNTDARILKSSSGKTVLAYAFPDKNTLIITTNEKTLSFIITKLRNAKLIR